MGLGKEKRMFTAIRSSYLYLESLKMQHSIMKKSGALALCIQIRISLKGMLW